MVLSHQEIKANHFKIPKISKTIGKSGSLTSFNPTLPIHKAIGGTSSEVYVCDDVSNITTVSIAQTSVDFTWTQGGTETAWEYVVQVAGTGVPTANGAAAGSTSVNEGSLVAGEDYEIYVRSDCGSGGYGNWIGPVNFTTLCGDVSNIVVSDITDVDADVVWDVAGAENNWEYVVQLAGTGTPGGSGVSSGSNSVTLSGLTAETNYEIYVRSDCGSGNYGSWVGPINFTTTIQTDYIVDCTTGGTDVIYCYDNNDDTLFYFSTTTAYTILNVVFNDGLVEDNVDVINVYDSDGTTVLYSGYGNLGDLAGLSFSSSGAGIYVEILSDGANSCATGEIFGSLDMSVSCATCTPQDVVFEVFNDCDNAPGFYVNVLINDMGSATTLLIEDDQGSAVEVATVADLYKIGPYANGTNVEVTVTNGDNPLCFVESDVLTQTTCPPMSTSETEYTYEELVKEVLIGYECSEVYNVQGSTGLNYGVDYNGIGYFYNSDNFDFTSGVVLSTGDIDDVPGPNTGNNSGGTLGWLGDPYLTTLASQVLPNPTTTYNESYLEFDFVPQTDFISFDFVFASMEYQAAFECTYSDVFAFVLTDPNGVSTNLAVIPGTSPPQPVTVVSVHGGVGSCGPANAAYFNDYIAVGSGSINFNGYTTVLTASSNVTVGETYHIKLTIADAGDASLNSAVFLGAGTFNIGDPLGPDLTLTDLTAPCEDEEVVLSSTDDGNTTFQWYFEGNPIPGETNSSYTVQSISNGGLGTGTYGLQALQGGAGGCSSTIEDDVLIEFADLPTVNSVDVYLICEDIDDGYETFDLTSMQGAILGGQTDVSLSYYLTEQGAEEDLSAYLISNPAAFINTNQYTQTVYVRLEDDIFGCVSVNTIDLLVSSVIVNTPDDLEVCDQVTPNDSFEEFDLTVVEDEVMSAITTPSDYTISYYTNQIFAEGGTLSESISTPDAFTNTNSGSQTIFVRVENNVSGCYDVVSFTVIVNQLPGIVTPTPFYGCDDDGDGLVTFYLNEKNNEIINGQTAIMVTYFETMTDLVDNNAPLSNVYQSTSTTIYVKLTNADTGCYNVTALDLIVVAPPVATVPSSIQLCDNDNDGFGSFDLTYVDNEVTPNDGNTYLVTFYGTEVDAQNGVNNFSSPYENIVQDAQTIYVRVENETTGCYDVVALDLIVEPTPVVPMNLPDLEYCDDVVADGYTEFDLSEQDANVYDGLSTSDYTISYYLSQTGAEMGLGALVTSYYTNIIQYQQEIFVRLENNLTGCSTIRSFFIIVNPNPVISSSYDHTLSLCDDFGEANDETTVFDLTVENDEVTGGATGYGVTYYESLADAKAGTNAVPDDTAYTNVLGNPYTMYIRVEDLNTGCYSTSTVTLRVLNNPTPLSAIEPLESCDDDLDGDENNGQVEFDLTIDEVVLLNGESGVTAMYYETYNDAFNGLNAIGNPSAYYNITPYQQTIYVAVTNDNTGCLTIVDFDLIVIPLPELTVEPTYYLCELDNNDEEVVPLTDMDSWVLAGAATGGYEISYYETESDAIADQYQYAGPNITVYGTESIAVRVQDTLTGCVQTLAYTIDIEQAPLATPPDVYALCESLGTDGYYNNDGVEVFNLTLSAAAVLGGQDATVYTVTLYETYADAENQQNELPVDEWDAYETGSNTLYAIVTNNSTGCINGDPITIVLEVESLPEVVLDELGGIVCVDATNNPIIGTDLGAGYTYAWNTGATSPTIEITEGGEYYVTITDINSYNQCSYESNHVYLEEASLPSVTPMVLQSEMFNGENRVEVISEGVGVSDFEYQLDNEPMQSSGLFTGIEPGIHTITITEMNGCGSLTLEISVIDYMKYFTPNGDGVNDTWRVIGLESQTNAQIFIFDRQGKLVKQMSSTSDGWNGTYNGNMLPSSDYWFKVVYTEPNTGEVKEFNSHFTLKR
ncbi:hypothetical protein NBRC110019_23340 [Neptunitalea chrysea]|uniref:Fibronectin type-III domain-containing protein n=2 Tax=Neptunitalea chrysea TaxID=1647581 RepID=A0A9W6B908_9FLAO|nr:hypothetical protein NBRC110019_23340 [Neptunitalea chrysea]